MVSLLCRTCPRREAPHAFPSNERLRRKPEFLFAYQEGAKLVGGAFVCYVVRREHEGRKFGCTVSRKVGGAVVRNRVKRYLREIYRTHRGQLPPDIHLVVVARPAAARMAFHECRESLLRLLQKGGLLGG